MDECLLINVIVLFVWIMAQHIRCFHPLDVGKQQLMGIKAEQGGFSQFFFFFTSNKLKQLFFFFFLYFY